MEGKSVANLQCQRIGCNAVFTEDDNPDGSCQYHDSPLFHDGNKEWSCCKKKSYDFSLFLEIPGCKTGKHTTEKPVLAKAATAPKIAIPAPIAAPSSNPSAKDSCSRCRQGFFCSDHGSQVKSVDSKSRNSTTVATDPINVVAKPVSAPVKKIVDINQPQVCKNKGCGVSFKEKDNHASACSYHPGPAVFHDGVKGWKCCDVHVKEFDEFMDIPTCTKGWHSANPEL